MPRVIITVPGSTPQPYLFQLDRKSVTLGRGSINDIVVDCPSVSVRHAEMRRVEGGYELRDIGSTNGIHINGEERQVIPLHDGDSARLGDVAFDFTLNDGEKETLGRERPMEESPIIRETVEETETEAPVRRLPELMEEPDLEQTADHALPERKPKKSKTKGAALSEGQRFGCAWVFWTLLIAVIAFILGMSVRFKQGTGDSWFESVKERFVPSQPKSPAPPAPTAP